MSVDELLPATHHPFNDWGHMRHGPDCSACWVGPWPHDCGGLIHQDDQGNRYECDVCDWGGGWDDMEIIGIFPRAASTVALVRGKPSP